MSSPTFIKSDSVLQYVYCSIKLTFTKWKAIKFDYLFQRNIELRGNYGIGGNPPKNRVRNNFAASSKKKTSF